MADTKQKYTGKVMIPFKVGHGKKRKHYRVDKPFSTTHKGTYDLLIMQKRIK